MTSKQQHITRLVRARQAVKEAEDRRRDAIRRRNETVRAAKEAGIPAADAYRLAGITQSTYSRQEATD